MTAVANHIFTQTNLHRGAPVTEGKEWWEDLPTVESLNLPAFDMSGIKPFDTSGLATFDDIQRPADLIDRECPGCGCTFRAYPGSNQRWCSDRCGWRMRKRRQRELLAGGIE